MILYVGNEYDPPTQSSSFLGPVPVRVGFRDTFSEYFLPSEVYMETGYKCVIEMTFSVYPHSYVF